MNIQVRPITKEDAPRLVKYANNRKIWLNLRDYFPHPYKMDDAIWFIEMCNSHETNKIFAISTEDGFVGIVGVHPLTDIYAQTGELGYWLGEEYWGNGYTSHAVRWMVNYTWGQTDLQRLEAGVFEHNVASMQVLEKCGFEKECIKRRRLKKDGEFYDEHFYGMIRPEEM